MATAMKTKATKPEPVKTETTVSKEEAKQEKVEAVKKVEKTYAPTDGIPCKSITQGGLYMPGLKSHILYTWVDAGDVVEVEYQDLMAAIRSNNGYIMSPLFVIEDEEVIEHYPQIKKLYESLYSIGELEDVILELDPASMKATILSLPEGARNSISHLASKMLSDGRLDSVKKIKILDEIFDTDMTVMTGLFS